MICEEDLRKNTESREYQTSFKRFFFERFSVAIRRVHRKFLFGEHLCDWADIIQAFHHTSILSARKHLKTTIHLAYLAWRLKNIKYPIEEWAFMSYKANLASYHLKNLKRYIKALPEDYAGFKDLTESDSMIRYAKDGKEFIVDPLGILSFERGRHPYGMIVDDILKDPTQKLDLAQIEKITNIFLEDIESMPTNELHLCGTPQDESDLFSKIKTMPDYFSIDQPAIKDGKPLWKDKFSIDILERIRQNLGNKAFNKEYLCRPTRGEDSFVSVAEYDRLVISRLRNHDVNDECNLKRFTTVGGFDIGKKTHPSHLSVFQERHGKLFQIHNKFMDGWNYIDQIEYCRLAIQRFQIDRLLYDNTRGEFEQSYERGELPPEMDGVVFGAKNKFSMSALVDKFISNKQIYFIKDERQRNQILSVDCDLKAPQTAQGHGDAFFSLCLAVQALEDAKGVLVWTLGKGQA